nr:uncharacterized protein LOC115850395 [Globicephala melas]
MKSHEACVFHPPSAGSDEEYIYMNKVTVHKQQDAESQDKAPEEQSPLTNGEPSQHSSAPQKSLPDLPPPKIIPERKQLSTPKIESPEGYYEEAEPYDTSLNGTSWGRGLEGVQSLPARRPVPTPLVVTGTLTLARNTGQPGWLLLESVARIENWPQSIWPLVCWGAETYSRPNPPTRRGLGWSTRSWFTVSDAFCGPAWMLLDSAQKCDKEEVCWPRGTRPRKQWKCGQAEPEPSFQVLSLD